MVELGRGVRRLSRSSSMSAMRFIVQRSSLRNVSAASSHLRRCHHRERAMDQKAWDERAQDLLDRLANDQSYQRGLQRAHNEDIAAKEREKERERLVSSLSSGGLPTRASRSGIMSRSSRSAASMRPKSLQQSYNLPMVPSPSLASPSKAPTLQDMERDLKKWGRNKDELASAKHEGRLQEHARAAAMIEELAEKEAEHRERAKVAYAEVKSARAMQQETALQLEKAHAELREKRRRIREAEAARDVLEVGAAGIAEASRASAVAQERELVELRDRVVALEKELRSKSTALAGFEKRSSDGSRKAELKRLREDHKSELEAMADNHRKEIVEMDLAHASEVEGLRLELDEQKERINARAEQQVEVHKRERAKQATKEEAERKRNAELKAELASTEDSKAELATMAENHKAELAAVQIQHALEMAELQGELDAQKESANAKIEEQIIAREKELADLAIKEDEARKENFMRQAIRRLNNRDLAFGFSAWVEHVEARTYALNRMREIANRLNPETRALAEAFYFWVEDSSEAGKAARLEQLETRVSKMTMLLEVRDKEIKRLKLELQIARPEDKATVAAREKREAQIRTMQKRQAAEAKKKSGK